MKLKNIIKKLRQKGIKIGKTNSNIPNPIEAIDYIDLETEILGVKDGKFILGKTVN